VTRKVLFCATVADHFKSFHLPFMRWFQEQGWEVHIAAHGDIELPYVNKKYNIPIQRSPLNIKNIKAFNELKSVIDNNNYKIIHCHTPVGGMLARLAALRARKYGAKVIYTAHGFHFCKEAPLVNWLLYYPIEKWWARYTDCLITINQEDYARAVIDGFKAGSIERVHGMGVDVDKYKPTTEPEKNNLRKKHRYKVEQFILFYAAELNKNKNQSLLIKSVSNLKRSIPNIKLLLAGKGALEEEYRKLALKEKVQNEVDFLGYRSDIDELLKLSDVAVASSLREGLPISIAEAMACGLPLVVSHNRGHNELVADGVNGYVIPDNNYLLFSEKLLTIYKDLELRMKMGNESLKQVATYNLIQVGSEMSQIYRHYM